MVLAIGRRFTDLCLLGVKGQTVTLTLRDGLDGPIFYGPETRSAVSVAGSYSAFCFDDVEQQREMLWHDLPSLNSTHATIEIAAFTEAQVALVAFGRGIYIGDAVYGFTNKFDDRGLYYEDADRNPVALQRGYSKGASGVIEATRAQHNSLIKFCGEYVGVPCIWIPAPEQADLSGTVTYGRFSSASVGVSGLTHTTFNLEVSGTV